jgi:signal transduction histidine kinase
MLDFTRPKILEKRKTDMSSWLDKALDEISLPSHISLVRRIDPDLLARIDGARLHRCISNILENAIEAMEGNNGTIDIEARLDGGRIEIKVVDTGTGITEERQKMIFDPLFSTKTNRIGMGLPVCRQVMELHGGIITIQSKAGIGTTASLRLPGFS